MEDRRLQSVTQTSQNPRMSTRSPASATGAKTCSKGW